MVDIRGFDARIVEDLAWAAADPEAAARLLLVAAEYLRSGEQMPHNLADHLASAFEKAAKVESHMHRGKELLLELKLTARHARPKGDWYDVGRAVEASLRAGNTITTALNDAVADPLFGIESPATARKLYNEYLAKVSAAEVANDADDYAP